MYLSIGQTVELMNMEPSMPSDWRHKVSVDGNGKDSKRLRVGGVLQVCRCTSRPLTSQCSTHPYLPPLQGEGSSLREPHTGVFRAWTLHTAYSYYDTYSVEGHVKPEIDVVTGLSLNSYQRKGTEGCAGVKP